MKKLVTLGFSTLLALFSSYGFAESHVSSDANTTTVSVEASKPATTVNVNLVNINTATAAEIQDKLVGIGAKKAQAIVEYREKNGQFIALEQLTEVSGIGKAILDKNRERIVLE